ncbi:hypothetical protein [Paenibacillus borealis]|uniref:Butirosin biosynthesis protein H N-terminal domain-containing protein n=1 Tax=Paenibacillus borealis TaxID=160799 RepID=A0A089L841_PAEBO|nr:hypothetical protein [Paenibacillus borealis]AIQ56952.1 hypothetical protein PBOR_08430 [Paenibacillus borealis]
MKEVINPIKLIHENSMTCIESSLATAANWFSRKYELMFSDLWDFRYCNPNDPIIGKRIFPLKSDPNNLEAYHGVRAMKAMFNTPSELVETVKFELYNGRPVSLGFDQYYLPWASESRRKEPNRYRGFVMATGFDKNGMYCLDVHGTRQTGHVPYYNFIQGCTLSNMFLTFTLARENELLPSMGEFVNLTEQRLYKKREYQDNVFHGIKCLAYDILASLDLDNEGTAESMALVDSIKSIANSRNLFCLTLKMYAENSKSKCMDDITKRYRVLGTKWFTVNHIIQKAIYSPHVNKSVNRKLGELILNICAIEEELIAELVRINQHIKQDSINETESQKRSEMNKNITNYYYIDIQEYTNDAVFFTPDEVPHNLEGIYGRFIIENDVFSGRTIKKGNMRFKLDFSPKRYDNIVCLNQTLLISEDSYSHIMLMGYSENGDFYNSIILNFEDQTKEEIFFGFSDCRWPRTLFGEEIILSGKRYHSHGVFKYYLFGLCLGIKNKGKLKSITLPNCWKIHICSITLGISN